MSAPVRLDPADVEAIAQRVAELVLDAGATATATRWLTAEQVAARLGLSRATVYERADELGAVRIGSGPRGRLRFDAAVIDDALTARGEGRASNAPEPTPRRASRRRPRPTTGGGGPLLPIRGVAGPEPGGVECP